MEAEFNYEAFSKRLIEDIREGKSLIGRDGIFTPLIKMALEGSLKAELQEHLEAHEALTGTVKTARPQRR